MTRSTSLEQTALSVGGRPSTPAGRLLGAAVAPAARDAGAAGDEQDLVTSRAIIDAFRGVEGQRGLRREEIAARAREFGAGPDVESRIEMFVRCGALRPPLSKKHQQTLLLHPAVLAGQLAFERLIRRGGVGELLTLLDATFSDLADGRVSEQEAAAALADLHLQVQLLADEADRLSTAATLQEILEEHRGQDARTVVARVADLQTVVSECYPAMDSAAFALVTEAQRYLAAVQGLVDRLLDEGGDMRSFELLSPEQYWAAAIDCGRNALAAASEHLAFDRAPESVDLHAAFDAVLAHRPPGPRATRPAPPAADPLAEDPVARQQKSRAQRDARRINQAELLLQGAGAVEVTDKLRAAGWPGAAVMAAEVLTLHRVDDRYRAICSDDLIVDSAGPVTHATPLRLEADRASRLHAVEDGTRDPPAELAGESAA